MGRRKKWKGRYRISSFLIPADKEFVIEEARAYARRTGKSLGEIIIEALELYIGLAEYEAEKGLEDALEID